MKSTKMALSRELVKQIFPGTEPKIAVGEDGSVVYDFKQVYPANLGIFIPAEVDRSNFNAVLPKAFESYFRNFDQDLAFLSRLLETEIASRFQGYKIEYVSGQMVKTVGRYTAFRFDELIDAQERVNLLCRTALENLPDREWDDLMYEHILYNEVVIDLAETEMAYFIINITDAFELDASFIAAVFNSALATPRKH